MFSICLVILGLIVVILFTISLEMFMNYNSYFFIPILIGILLISHAAFALFGHRIPVKVKEHTIVIMDNSAYAIGNNINFNEKLGKNFKDGAKVYEFEVQPYWHRGYYWVGENFYKTDKNLEEWYYIVE